MLITILIDDPASKRVRSFGILRWNIAVKHEAVMFLFLRETDKLTPTLKEYQQAR